MTMIIILIFALSFALCMAAPAAHSAPASMTDDTLRALINPPMDVASSSLTNKDNMVDNAGVANQQGELKTITDFKQALAASVKSQLMTSFANLSPEQASMVPEGNFANNQLSQLNLMGGINKLVALIVEKLIQSLLPNIFGQRPMPSIPAPAPAPAPTGNMGGLFGNFGSMNPMGMMMPGMMFGMMDKMFEFI